MREKWSCEFLPCESSYVMTLLTSITGGPTLYTTPDALLSLAKMITTIADVWWHLRYSIFFKLLFYVKGGFGCTHVCAPHMCLAPIEARRGHLTPLTEVTDSCELSQTSLCRYIIQKDKIVLQDTRWSSVSVWGSVHYGLTNSEGQS